MFFHQITLPSSKNLLSLPAFPEANHPWHRKMSLLICLLSGNKLKIEASHPNLSPSLLHPGGKGQGLYKWLEFCKQKDCDVLSPSLPLALAFLSMLYEKGSSYSAINTARSMLSSILQLNIYSSTPFDLLSDSL